MKFIQYIDQLNENQKEAVLTEGNCIVNASVGSGKTTVLTAKVNYLHEVKGIPLEKMMVLTFTNKAADEIRHRLSLEENIGYIGTFHAVALYVLKNDLPIENLGFTNDFQVIGPDEELDLAQRLIQLHKLQIKYKNRLKKRLEQVLSITDPQKKISKYGDDIFELCKLLQEEKKKENKMTFFDLLYYASFLLKDSAKKPDWIIVDEVQDCNEQQIDMITYFMGAHTKLFFVGDPNQVIYSWRGSDATIFYRLKHAFHMKEITLPLNYRSSQTILDAARYFQQNPNVLQSVSDAGNPILVKRFYDPFQEAFSLATEFRKLKEQGVQLSQIAVFYRLQDQVKLLCDIFDREGIPYHIHHKQKLIDIPVLYWLQHLLRTISNVADTTSAMLLLTDRNYGEGLTAKKAEVLLQAYHRQENVPSCLLQAIRQIQLGWLFPTDTDSFYEMLSLDKYLHPTLQSYESDQILVKRYLDNLFSFCDTQSEKTDLPQMIRLFLNEDSLQSVLEQKNEETRGVQLMTLHASKGLEFQRVYILGVNTGLIPLHTTTFALEEEERRLFFVGMTRAKEELILTYYTNPGSPRVQPGESKYLNMIPPKLLNREAEERLQQKEVADSKHLQSLKKQVQEVILAKKNEELPIEEENIIIQNHITEHKVAHKKYGTGYVVREDDTMITVAFAEYGEKEFVKLFAELTEL